MIIKKILITIPSLEITQNLSKKITQKNLINCTRKVESKKTLKFKLSDISFIVYLNHDSINQVKLLTINLKCKDVICFYLTIPYLMVLAAAHLYSIPLHNYDCTGGMAFLDFFLFGY